MGHSVVIAVGLNEWKTHVLTRYGERGSDALSIVYMHTSL